jgi:hypothetical protein
MYKIKIQDRTAFQAINLWTPNRTSTVVFDVSNNSSFGIFAEGVALGKLRDLELDGFEVIINLQHSPLTCRTKGQETVGLELLPPVLSTLFGLELLHLSKSVEVDGDDLGIDLRSLIGTRVWREVQRNKGVINSGKCVYLVSRHMYPVPVALRQSPSSHDFPSFDSFQKNLTLHINSLRGMMESSQTEQKLIEWVFHCAENAHDHAEKYQGRPIEGYRGILLQKVKIELGEDVCQRGDLPELVKNFVSQRKEDGEIGKEAIINIATVVDLGAGIHNTIPEDDNVRQQSGLERLQYAFKDGVTSKNVNDHERAGYGLGEAANAARFLKALLFIVSGDQVAFYDFSDEAEKQIPGEELFLTTLGKLEKRSGSAISLMWASNQSQEDQLSMNI